MVVDGRGLACPLPVVKTKKAVEELKEDGVVTVLVDNEIAVQNLTKFATQRNLTVESEKKAEKEYQVDITVSRKALRKAEAELNADDEEAEVEDAQDMKKPGLVVVLSANVMGGGDEKLGVSLMKAFVFALTKQDRLPESILLYNTGAYLSCEGSDSLEDLKCMAEEGVNIMTCGTCLDFYGIKEKLAVGTVTNMYDIVETMERAKTIVRP
ncbi:sulfurtransferase-like selenium metabolism protein YedF [Hespellia stercorisuis]|uniref:Selenium metabolism protein YedF n=1 Tax=Hespellia stercorisuis DSM 15480 TaxID=1121950 RepID=A0A1M6RSZ6_9FIRM|nr:sulfurtransferase-like selenium metabolism protein YedF [Hespellia stercorisuis]SHK35545.1 selenium metabolism protein YedF [Hespellia stercorisuis DSM 15480]